MGIQIESIQALLILAALVAILARRLKLPYTIGLLVAGMLVAVAPWHLDVTVTKELIFSLFLPPLIFEAAFALHWDELKRDMTPLVSMATIGVVASTAVVYSGLVYWLHWDWRPALVFSTLISATDPVSVIAMLKEAKVGGRFRLLLEAESLFNDGTAAALFVVALAAVSQGSLSLASAFTSFLVIAGGGLLCGAIVGGLSVLLMKHTEEAMVEITWTVVAAYGSFLLAEHFHFSGVLATVVTGVMIGNAGKLAVLSEKGRDDAETFWEFAAFLVNSLIFLLMGARLAQVNYLPVLGMSVIAILLVMLGRSVAVYGILAAFARSRYRVDMGSQHLMVWGGMRGALALALALGLPESLPGRETVVEVTFAIVFFSTVVQGITMKPAMKRLLKSP